MIDGLLFRGEHTKKGRKADMKEKFNVAILGAGNIAGSMAAALSGIKEDVYMYAVASRSLDKAKEFKEKWGFEKAYGSYEELAMDENVDLIYIATPHSEHYNNVKLCLSNGRNCLVEKAFCGNLKQTKELLALAKEKDVYLGEAMWTRYQPSKDIIQGVIDEGAIGNITEIVTDFSVPINVERMTNPALAGGALLDLGVYSLTVPTLYIGTDIESVKVESVLTDLGVDATDNMTLIYKNGIKVNAKCSFVENTGIYGKIIGDKGYLYFEMLHVPSFVDVYDLDGNKVKRVDINYIANGYEYEILESKARILAGKKEPKSMPWSETIRLMGWMDSIRNHIGVVYPFENKEDIVHSDMDVWGIEKAF